MESRERAAAGRQVRKVAGKVVQRVVIDEYQCPSCERWVDVVRKPEEWDKDRCVRCA